MKVTLWTRIKALLSGNSYDFWSREITDEEKNLRAMDVWQLAKIIHEAEVRKNNREKSIVAEHMLGERLARIQARPAYWAILAGLVGTIGGVLLASALQHHHDPVPHISACQKTCGEQNKLRGAVEIQPAKPPTNAIVEIPHGIDRNREPKRDAPAKP